MHVKPPPPTSNDRSNRLWRWYCIIAALEAGAAIAALLAVPREGPGFSLARLGVLAVLLGALCVFGTAAVRLNFRTLDVPESLIAGLVSLALLAAGALYVLRYLDPSTLLPHYQRLSIPLLYLLTLCLQALVLLSLPNFKRGPAILRNVAGNLLRGAAAWLILLLLLALVALTKLGVRPDPAYWGEPGVPILGWQLAGALLCGVLTLLVSLRRSNWSRLDLAIGIAIWLAAVIAWLLVPLGVLKNSFYAPITPPAYLPFPNSDAGYYDSMAQSLLIGHPYQGQIPSRPLYILLLAGLHLLLGQRYDLIIVGQTFILAMIPVALFWLGKEIHSRPAGAIAASAAIGREWTSLMVSSATRVSNSKMLLVDLPTLLGMLLCTLLVLRWLKQQDARSAATAGGGFALLLLLRSQVLALLPLAMVFGLLVLGIRQRRSYVQLAVLLGALALTLAPWMIHNYLCTGQLSLDAAFQYRIIASQYSHTGNLDIQNVDLEGKSMLGLLLAFVAKDPGFVLGFIANHSLATLVGSLLALPLLHASPGLMAPVDPYWVNWSGTLDTPNLALVIGYLGIIGLGMAAAWRRTRLAGLLPLGLAVGYSLTNGIARFSGWRYDLPADWVAYFYFAAGAAEILLLCAALFGMTRSAGQPVSDGPGEARTNFHLQSLLPMLAAFAFVGALPWLAAEISAPRFQGANPVTLVARLSRSRSVEAAGITAQQIAVSHGSRGTVLEIGTALYPRFFSRGVGLASAHPWPAYAPRDFPRLGFVLLNQKRQDVLVPSRDIPVGVDHGSDAIVLGCQRDGYIEARLVLMPETDVLIQGKGLSDPCE